MELSLLIGKQVASMLLMVACGYLLVRSGKIKPGQSQVLTTVALYIFSPSMLIYAFQMEYDPLKIKGLCFAIGLAVFAHILFILASRFLFFRKDGERVKIDRASATYCNTGNLILPLIGATMGQESMFYASGYLLVIIILMFTVLVVQMSGDMGQMKPKSLLTNINLMAILLGFVLFLCNIRLPSVLFNTVEVFSRAMAPAAMLIIGMIIGGTDLKKLFTSRRLYFVCFLRLILYPLMLLLVIRFTGLNHLFANGTQLCIVSLISAAAPVGATVPMLAQLYTPHEAYASQLVSLSTLLCVVTLPLMVLVGQWMLG